MVGLVGVLALLNGCGASAEPLERGEAAPAPSPALSQLVNSPDLQRGVGAVEAEASLAAPPHTEATSTTIEPAPVATESVRVLFASGSAQLTAEARDQLDVAAPHLSQTIGTIEVVGSADGVGELETNQGLSLQRAVVVAEALSAATGIELQRFDVDAVGESQAVDDNHDATLRSVMITFTVQP